MLLTLTQCLVEVRADLGGRGVHKLGVGFVHAQSIGEVIVAHRRGGEDMNMGVWDVKPGDNIAGARGIERLDYCAANVLGYFIDASP